MPGAAHKHAVCARGEGACNGSGNTGTSATCCISCARRQQRAWRREHAQDFRMRRWHWTGLGRRRPSPTQTPQHAQGQCLRRLGAGCGSGAQQGLRSPVQKETDFGSPPAPPAPARMVSSLAGAEGHVRGSRQRPVKNNCPVASPRRWKCFRAAQGQGALGIVSIAASNAGAACPAFPLALPQPGPGHVLSVPSSH